jgi:outer membrane murein-binding lipoprotein Lpp
VLFFGRPGGPARLVISVLAVVVIGLLTFVVANLNNKLDIQHRTDEATLQATGQVVNVNDRLTQRLAQLTALTHSAQSALTDTKALGPLLVKLREALQPAAATVSSATSNVETTHAQLTTIQGVLNVIRNKVVPLVSSAQTLGGQGRQLRSVVRGLVSDLQAAVAAAMRINQSIPLPG